MSANINLSVPEASTHTHTHTQGPKTTCYIPRRLQAVGEEVEAIYGCFRGLSNTPSASFLSLSRLVLPFLFLCFTTESSFPSMQCVIHAPASKTLPACFVCRTDGNRPNKVPSSLLFLKVSPQATAFFWRGRRPVLLKNLLKVHACAFLCLWKLNLPDPMWPSVSIRLEPPVCQLLSSANVALTLTVQVKQNKRPRSLDVVKQKCVLAVNTGGRRLCKQAWFLWPSWSWGEQFVVRLFRFVSPHHHPLLACRHSCGLAL